MEYRRENVIKESIIKEIKESGSLKGKKIPVEMLQNPKFYVELETLLGEVIMSDYYKHFGLSPNISYKFDDNKIQIDNQTTNNDGFVDYSWGTISFENGHLVIEKSTFMNHFDRKGEHYIYCNEQKDKAQCTANLSKMKKIIDSLGIERANYKFDDKKINENNFNFPRRANVTWGNFDFNTRFGFIPEFPSSDECRTVAVTRFDDSQLLLPEFITLTSKDYKLKPSVGLIPLIGEYLDKIRYFGKPIAVYNQHAGKYVGYNNLKYDNMDINEVVSAYNAEYKESILQYTRTDNDIKQYIAENLNTDSRKL